MLATFTVVSLGDESLGSCQPSACTLRSAIEAANGNQGLDTIAFDANVFATPQTINLSRGELPITDAITIDGPGQGVLTIDAQQQSRIFNVVPGNTPGDFDITINGLNLTGGRTTADNQSAGNFIETTHSGGAIRFNSTGGLTMTGCTVSRNGTTGRLARGGGVFSRGSITLVGSTVSENSTAGDHASGGGVYSRGPITSASSIISENSTTGNSATGGGILSIGSATLTGSTISGNSTMGAFSAGGGVHSVGSVTLVRSTISDNSTKGDATAGGGVSSQGSVTLTNSTIAGNRTEGNRGQGGGILAFGSVTLMGSTISGNSTVGELSSGGGVHAAGSVALMGSTISGNSTAGDYSQGGGVFAGNSLDSTTSTISGNSTAGLGSDGGGAFSAGSVTLANSTISGNSTEGDDAQGGGVYSQRSVRLVSSTISGNITLGEAADGGGIFIVDSRNNFGVHSENSIVAGNSTSLGTGPDFLPDPEGTLSVSHSLVGDNSDTGLTAPPVGSTDSNGNLIGSSESKIDPLLGQLQDNGGLTQTHTLLPGSPAIDAGDPSFDAAQLPYDQRGQPFLRGADGGSGLARVDMGAYERQTLGDLSLVVDTTVDDSDGNYSDGDLSLREAVELAGGSVGPDTITFDASVFSSAQAINLRLGELPITEAVTIDGPGQNLLTIDAQQQSRIFNIVPGSTAGDFDVTIAGLSLTGGKTTADNQSLGRSLESTHSGGAIRFNSTATLTLSGSTILGSKTDGFGASGGGVFSLGSVTLSDSTISGNYTEGDHANGGGVMSFDSVTLLDSTISENRTVGESADGGGVFAFGSVRLSDSTISGNRTQGQGGSGGGVFSAGPVTVLGSSISLNSTAGRFAAGGGVSSFDSVTLTNSTISENSTAGESADGGGVYTVASFGSVTLLASMVSGNSTAGESSRGGGVYSISRVTMIASTISGNYTTGDSADGGGVYSPGSVTLTGSTVSGNGTMGDHARGGGVFSSTVHSVTLMSSTISGNSTHGDSADGGGIFIFDRVANPGMLMANSIIAENTVLLGNGPDFLPDPDGTLNVSHSLIGDNTDTGLTVALVGSPDANGNLIGTSVSLINPMIGPLADNGGATMTHALLPDSPAVDAGDNTSAQGSGLLLDQRGNGFFRILDGGSGTATIDIGAFEFSLAPALDFGDAPTAGQSGFDSDYPVTHIQNGARHSASRLFLGSLIDGETEGQPDNTAGQDGDGGDDSNGVSDEDGVVVVASMVATIAAATKSSFVITASGDGKLDAWIDFNQDGDWDDTGEQVFTNRLVTAGLNLLSFDVPAGSIPGSSGARFRLSSAGELAPTGAAPDGEVEDYIVMILDGDTEGGAAVEIEPPISGTLDVVADGTDVVVRSGASEFFRAPGASLGRIDIFGLGGDDTLNVANLDTIFSGTVVGDAGEGNDTLNLTGSDQRLDLTDSSNSGARGIEAIDITGSGGNTLTLDVNEVLNISSTTDTLRVRHNGDDIVNYGNGWLVDTPQVVDGQFVHLLRQTSATIQVVNTLPFQNPLNSLDTNHDNRVSPLDALIIINRLNTSGAGVLSTPTSVAGVTVFFYIDTSGDQFVAPVDVIRIVNFLNDPASDPEGEFAAPRVDSTFVGTVDRTLAEEDSMPALYRSAGFVIAPMATKERSQRETPDFVKRLASRAKDEDLATALDIFFGDYESESL